MILDSTLSAERQAAAAVLFCLHPAVSARRRRRRQRMLLDDEAILGAQDLLTASGKRRARSALSRSAHGADADGREFNSIIGLKLIGGAQH